LTRRRLIPPPLWRWTLSHQILSLVAVSVLASQLAGLVVLLTLPPRPQAPPPIEQTLDRIRVAIKQIEGRSATDAGRQARAASDHRLIFSLADQPPAAQQDPFSTRLSNFISGRLGLPPDAVRVIDQGSPRGAQGARWPGQFPIGRGQGSDFGGSPGADGDPPPQGLLDLPAPPAPTIVLRQMDPGLNNAQGPGQGFRRRAVGAVWPSGLAIDG
jgi:hypothetical protein